MQSEDYVYVGRRANISPLDSRSPRHSDVFVNLRRRSTETAECLVTRAKKKKKTLISTFTFGDKILNTSSDTWIRVVFCCYKFYGLFELWSRD